MAKFPSFTARQELGVTPTTAVRFTGDARTGEGLVGQAIGQTIISGIGIIQQIQQKRQDMLDTRSSITAGSFITTAINENIAFRNTNADTMTWAKDLQERLSRAESQISALGMSEDARLLVNAKFQAKSQGALSRSLIAETDRDREDTRATIIADVVEQYTNGTVQDQKDAGRRFLEIAPALMDENEARATLKTAIMAGQKARTDVMVSVVHAAAEAGNFEAARELAKNPIIPEPQQTTLRSMIDSAEKAIGTANKLAQDRRDDEIGDTFLKLLDNKLDPTKPQLTFEMISRSTEMSFDAKSAWFTKLQVFDNYSEGELKEAFTDKGEVIADIYDKIDAGTLTDELDTMVGRGLSPTTAERIKKEIREPYEKDTDKLFKNIFGWSPELGFENDLSSFLYIKTERDWREEVKRQNATGEKIVEIGRSIARPYFIEHLQKTMMGQEADISRMVELALGEEIVKTEPEVLPKEDEGPRTQQDFLDEVSRLKAIDMTKAKAFYDAWVEKFRGTEVEEK